MQDLVIILPTHNRHDYLGSKIKYYADCGYEVYICDSTSNKFEYNKQMPVNISYLWMPGCGFYEKVLSTVLKSNHITFIGRAIRKIRWIMSGRKSWLEQTELIEMNIKIDKLLREKIIE